MIELAGVTKKYGQFTAVDNLDLKVGPGELFGFLGPNGAGKTTTIKMITGLLQPTSGTIRVAGFDLNRNPEEAKRHVGFIPDRPFIYNRLTAIEFLRFMGGLWEMSGPEIENRGHRLLDLFDLEDWRNELVESFSHGMRQKLILSGALIHDPDVIVVDEPMVGLDPASIRLVKDIFRQLCSRGKSVFMSTHTLAMAEETCSRVAIIQQGRIMAEGTLDELRAQASNDDSRLESIFLDLTSSDKVKHLDWLDGAAS